MAEWSAGTGDELVDALMAIDTSDGLPAFLSACRSELDVFRTSVPAAKWQEFVQSRAADRLRSAFLDDPYTRRGYEKPRGYAGDAVLLDYIYQTCPIPEQTSRRGLGIYSWMCTESKAFRAVRSRKAIENEEFRRRNETISS